MRLQKPIVPVSIPQETQSHLSSIPWCNRILSNPQEYIPIRSINRVPKSDTEDSFMAKTLATDDTFKIWQSFYKPNKSNSDVTETSHDDSSGELIFIISFGSGMSGHADTLHGGAISVALDETLGQVANLHCKSGSSIYTAFLNTSFQKPIVAPGVVLGRAWMVPEKSGGRKYMTMGTLEDGYGQVYATGEGLMVFVGLRTAKL